MQTTGTPSRIDANPPEWKVQAWLEGRIESTRILGGAPRLTMQERTQDNVPSRYQYKKEKCFCFEPERKNPCSC